MMFGRTRHTLEGGGLVLFATVEEALHAEKVLKNTGCACKLIAPPPALRKGCDLGLEVNLVEQIGVERALRNEDIRYLGVTPLKEGASEVLDVIRVVDFGDAVMVKAANMKLTFEKGSGLILNVSGGGCPDVPYLHLKLVGKKLTEAPKPRDIGFTLCGLMLERALDGCLEIWNKLKQER
jgi:hypothetical protein